MARRLDFYVLGALVGAVSLGASLYILKGGLPYSTRKYLEERHKAKKEKVERTDTIGKPDTLTEAKQKWDAYKKKETVNDDPYGRLTSDDGSDYMKNEPDSFLQDKDEWKLNVEDTWDERIKR